MAKVTIQLQDVEGSTTDFNIVLTCDPPLEAGKLPQTQSGKIAQRILAAMAMYLENKRKGKL